MRPIHHDLLASLERGPKDRLKLNEAMLRRGYDSLKIAGALSRLLDTGEVVETSYDGFALPDWIPPRRRPRAKRRADELMEEEGIAYSTAARRLSGTAHG
jgi:hypothetical protein